MFRQRVTEHFVPQLILSFALARWSLSFPISPFPKASYMKWRSVGSAPSRTAPARAAPRGGGQCGWVARASAASPGGPAHTGDNVYGCLLPLCDSSNVERHTWRLQHFI